MNITPSSPTLTQIVPRRQIIASRLNPRTYFCPTKHQELVASMRAHGFMPDEPLLVRPIEQDIYEVVKGERRLRAAEEVGVELIPVVVTSLGDGEALLLALVENLQREELSAMDEAKAYSKLLEARREGALLFSMEELAEKVGKTPAHIQRLTKLTKLEGTAAGRALEEGQIGIEHGLRIARLPSHELRERFTRLTLANPYGPSPMTAKELDAVIQREVAKSLKQAEFDRLDASLVPLVQNEDTGERVFGGECCRENKTEGPGHFSWTCPFADVSHGRAMCMLPACFEAKTAAAHEAWRRKVTAEREGVTTLPLAENAALWASSGQVLEFTSPYVELDDRPAELDLKPTVRMAPPWKKLLEGQTVPVVAARDAKGKTHLLVRKDLAMTAAIEAGHRIFRKGDEEAPAPAPQAEREAQADAAAQAAEEERREEVIFLAQIEAIFQSAAVLKRWPDGVAALLLETIFAGSDGWKIACERRKVHEEKLLGTVTATESMQLALLLEVLAADEWWRDKAAGDGLLKKLAKLTGADLKHAVRVAKAKLEEVQG